MFLINLFIKENKNNSLAQTGVAVNNIFRLRRVSHIYTRCPLK